MRVQNQRVLQGLDLAEKGPGHGGLCVAGRAVRVQAGVDGQRQDDRCRVDKKLGHGLALPGLGVDGYGFPGGERVQQVLFAGAAIPGLRLVLPDVLEQGNAQDADGHGREVEAVEAVAGAEGCHGVVEEDGARGVVRG